MWHPSTARRASSCALMISSAMPVSALDPRSMNSAVLRAAAGLGRDRAGQVTLRRLRSLSAQIAARRARGPSPVGSAARLRQPLAQPHDPAEKASTTTNSPRRAWRSAGGSCWCRDRSPHRIAAPGPRRGLARSRFLDNCHCPVLFEIGGRHLKSQARRLLRRVPHNTLMPASRRSAAHETDLRAFFAGGAPPCPMHSRSLYRRVAVPERDASA
jgi:hypothetical protein